MLNEWDNAYLRTPPWDVGHPQKEFIRLAERKEVSGSILEIGCGTGENSLFFASLGHEVLGIDISPKAIGLADKKRLSQRAQNVSFMVADALDLQVLKRKDFDNAIDCGLFHVFGDQDREEYLRELQSILRRNGTYFMMCMSNLESDDWGGPRRVKREEIREAFGRGNWRINYIRDAEFETIIHPIDSGAKAWLCSITRT